VNVPHRTAARDLASTAIYAGNPVLELEAYTAALSHGSIDRPFMVLLLLNRTTSVVQDPEILPTVKEAFLARAEEGLAFVRSEHAGDARIYFGAANMYGALGRLDEAQMYADLARSRAPTHPHMIRLQATLASQRGDLSLANEYLKDEYLVDVTRYDARRDYYTHLVEIGRAPEAEALLLEADDDFLRQYAVDDLRVGLLRNAQAFAALARLYEFRVEARPEALDEWANLSAYYQAMGQIEPAAAALERAGEAIPGLAPTLNCWAQNVRAGRPREEGC
jgi:tetratricopeptide (TPR) repeat protein